VRPREEQLMRARAIAAAGLQEMIHPDELSPPHLREALDRLLMRVPLQNLPDYYSVTERAAQILADLAGPEHAQELLETVAAAQREAGSDGAVAMVGVAAAPPR